MGRRLLSFLCINTNVSKIGPVNINVKKVLKQMSYQGVPHQHQGRQHGLGGGEHFGTEVSSREYITKGEMVKLSKTLSKEQVEKVISVAE